MQIYNSVFIYSESVKVRSRCIVYSSHYGQDMSKLKNSSHQSVHIYADADIQVQIVISASTAK